MAAVLLCIAIILWHYAPLAGTSVPLLFESFGVLLQSYWNIVKL